MDNENYLNLSENRQQRRKRSHEQMLEDDARIDSLFNDTPQYPDTASESLNRHFPPPSPLSRYPGDGLDFRRPAMSTRTPVATDVIDLTGPESPQSRPQRLERSRSRPGTQRPQPGQIVIDLEAEDGERHEDIQDLRTNTVIPTPSSSITFLTRQTGEGMERPGWVDQFSGAISMDSFAHRMRSIGRLSNFLSNTPFPRSRQRYSRPTPHHRRDNFVPPLGFEQPNLQYNNAAFSMAREAPTYQAPEPAKEGFTRTPSEGDILVCPNCDEELHQGDDEVKRQIWVIKSCGHVYCGRCAINRHKSGQKNRTATEAKTFTRCVVTGCNNKSTSSSKAMFQVYI